MLGKLFSKKAKEIVSVLPEIETLPEKTQTDIVAEIHEKFDTEVDHLLDQAGITKAGFNPDKVEKAHRLSALGFTSSTECMEGEKLEKSAKNAELLTECIQYFRQKYPLYKFITSSSIKRICEEYGLILGSVSEYIGTVPDKNLKELENFRVAEEDCCYQYSDRYSLNPWRVDCPMPPENPHGISSNLRYTLKQLQIVAPPKEFDLKGKRVVDYCIVDEDPIVLRQVTFQGMTEIGDDKLFLIGTKWGPEANDPDTINEVFN